uniref:Zinc finger, SWIM-type containing 7 n=1 Tax=Gasterosteus aculeatus aculeatus TaxID=481459 RepID=A0AAQ4QEH9_GASAC
MLSISVSQCRTSTCMDVSQQQFNRCREESIQDTQQQSIVPDDLLIALKFVFGSCALQALDLVDHHSVTCLSSPSGRKAFQVIGGSGRLYTCFASCHYCPCPAFAYSVLRRNDGLLCKHLLAIYLCEAVGGTLQESVSDQQMSALLSGTAAP